MWRSLEACSAWNGEVGGSNPSTLTKAFTPGRKPRPVAGSPMGKAMSSPAGPAPSAPRIWYAGLMSKRIAAVIVGFVLMPLLLSAKERVREWQTGKVLDTERSSQLVGFMANSSEVTGGVQPAVHRKYQTVVIEGATYFKGAAYTYQAQKRVGLVRKPAKLTVNTSVKFAVEKQKLYLIDEDGKEHEMSIIKQTLR